MTDDPMRQRSGDDARWDAKFMRQALSLASKAHGRVAPNPMVGALVVREGRVLGQGFHQRFGQAHAEVNALADARAQGHDVAGADLYVTLEPCSHFGKTPPCAQAVVDAKIGRVFCAMVDPFAQVAGRGIAMLREKGVTVHTGLLEDEARELNHAFIKRVETGLPWVTLKWAQSVDGKIAAASGDSRWISSAPSRRLVHQWRGRVDAVIVGIGTAVADDPQLTARDVRPRRIARPVVVDPNLRLPLSARLLQDVHKQPRPLLIATTQTAVEAQQAKADELTARGVTLLPLPVLTNAAVISPVRTPVDLRPLLAHLANEDQADHVLVEGGGVLHGQLIAQGLADQMLVFVGGSVIGDGRAQSGVTGLACDTMAMARQARLHRVKKSGEDVLMDWRLQPQAG